MLRTIHLFPKALLVLIFWTQICSSLGTERLHSLDFKLTSFSKLKGQESSCIKLEVFFFFLIALKIGV